LYGIGEPVTAVSDVVQIISIGRTATSMPSAHSISTTDILRLFPRRRQGHTSLVRNFARIVYALSRVAVSGLSLTIKIRYGRARPTSERERMAQKIVNIADANTKCLSRLAMLFDTVLGLDSSFMVSDGCGCSSHACDECVSTGNNTLWAFQRQWKLFNCRYNGL